MQVGITIDYVADLDEDDAEKIEAGIISVNDIDWSYYIKQSMDKNVVNIDIL